MFLGSLLQCVLAKILMHANIPTSFQHGHYTYSTIPVPYKIILTQSFLLATSALLFFLYINPTKCWTSKEETGQSLNTQYLNFVSGQTVFRVLFHFMDMMISGHLTSFMSNLFEIKVLIAHCVSFAEMRQREIEKSKGETFECLGYFKFLLKSKTQAPQYNGVYKHKLKNEKLG